MINAAVIGLGWWGQNILKNLLDSEVIKPVLGVDPLDSARASDRKSTRLNSSHRR